MNLFRTVKAMCKFPEITSPPLMNCSAFQVVSVNSRLSKVKQCGGEVGWAYVCSLNAHKFTA
jgi:hypothetical protein